MDYVSWTAALLVEIPKLWLCLRDNIYPTSFLTQVFFLSQDTAAELPRYLLGYSIIYLLCGGATLGLRLRKGQRSLNSWSDQVNNVILTIADFSLSPCSLPFGPWEGNLCPQLHHIRESLKTCGDFSQITGPRSFSRCWSFWSHC